MKSVHFSVANEIMTIQPPPVQNRPPLRLRSFQLRRRHHLLITQMHRRKLQNYSTSPGRRRSYNLNHRTLRGSQDFSNNPFYIHTHIKFKCIELLPNDIIQRCSDRFPIAFDGLYDVLSFVVTPPCPTPMNNARIKWFVTRRQRQVEWFHASCLVKNQAVFAHDFLNSDNTG